MDARELFPGEVFSLRPFSALETERFREAHRWNILLNRGLSRSFLYRSKTVFPTFWVAALKIMRDIQKRYTKTRLLLRTGHQLSRTQKIFRWLRLMIGHLVGSAILAGGGVARPFDRWRALNRISRRSGRDHVREFIDSTPRVSGVEPVIRSFKPDLVVAPTLGHEIVPLDAIRAAARCGTASMMLIDNWDNLSSKSLFSALPDFMGTWGPQSNSHAVDIQGMAGDRVEGIGAPRFEPHFRLAMKTDERRKSVGKFILYCGTSMYSNEDRILEILDQTLMTLNSSLSVVYRPHPQRFQAPGSGLKNMYGSVKIDPTVDEKFWGELLPYLPARDFDFATLLSESLFVVGGLTSALLEAEILGKKYLAMAHHEAMNYSSPRAVFNTYDHYRGIEFLPHLTLCRSLKRLPQLVGNHIRSPDYSPSSASNRLQRSHFLTGSGERSYEERLSAFIDKALDVNIELQ